MATKQRQVFHSALTRDGWAVIHNEKVVTRHSDQSDAEAAAISLGRQAYDKGGLGQAVFHDRDGIIKEERTYGEDPERTPG